MFESIFPSRSICTLSYDTPKHLYREWYRFTALGVERLTVPPHVVPVFASFAKGSGAAVSVCADGRVLFAQMGGSVDIEAGDVDEEPLVSHAR